MTLPDWVTTILLIVEYVMKVIAVGVVPENRRPSSSSAWLLLILFVPLIGFPLYWLIGSPWVRGRRLEIQKASDEIIARHTAALPLVPEGATAGPALERILFMNRNLTALPCQSGEVHGLHDDAAQTFRAMAEAVDAARRYVHVQYYIMAWDDVTDPFFQALARARQRGVTVRLLVDQLGSRKYPGWRKFQRRLTDIGVDWHLMMPISLLQRRWRRPDLRNHRKLMVVDGELGFMGSHNLIDPTYLSARNARLGRAWHDLSMKVSGDTVLALEAVFATDWFTESGELLDPGEHFARKSGPVDLERLNALQLVPSGPGCPSEPNKAMFIALLFLAQRRITITSPYFVPDEALLHAIISAVHRGVDVELFVGEEADQFIVGHSQRSYYRALLEAGVRIRLYPRPAVLHAKYLTVDSEIGVIGSSNMDYRSFALDYEIMMLGFGGNLVELLERNDQHYRDVSRELTLDEWLEQPWPARYLDNVCRLTSALM